ncbi:MAG TPA: hypothetical protein VMB52_00580 [Verrucomicrobiae bacterium]|nr:hypothetical protein [Verrucomicrobiae bacterium]
MTVALAERPAPAAAPTESYPLYPVNPPGYSPTLDQLEPRVISDADLERWFDPSPLPSSSPDTSTLQPDVATRMWPERATLHTSASETQDAPYEQAEFIVGKRFPRFIHEAATQSIKGWQRVTGVVLNAYDTPGAWRKRAALSLAEGSRDRAQRRLDDAWAKGKGGTKVATRRRELKQANAAVRGSQSSLNKHISTMENRVDAPDTNANARRKAYLEKLVDRAAAARARKAIRHNLQHEPLEVRVATMNALSEQEILNVGRAILRAEASDRRVRDRERVTRENDERLGAINRSQRYVHGQIEEWQRQYDRIDEKGRDIRARIDNLAQQADRKKRVRSRQLRTTINNVKTEKGVSKLTTLGRDVGKLYQSQGRYMQARENLKAEQNIARNPSRILRAQQELRPLEREQATRERLKQVADQRVENQREWSRDRWRERRTTLRRTTPTTTRRPVPLRPVARPVGLRGPDTPRLSIRLRESSTGRGAIGS